MKRALVVAALGCALAPAACATSQFDRHFEAGQYLEASRIFAEDSALQRREQAIFRAALVYALPASPVYEPTLARALFERLLTLYPKTEYRTHIAFLNGLLVEVQRLELTAAEREAELRRIALQIAQLEEHARWLESTLERQELQTNTFRDLTERLETELRQTRGQLYLLQEELDRLKEIDLKERRRPGQATNLENRK
jgi:hypothetical protein